MLGFHHFSLLNALQGYCSASWDDLFLLLPFAWALCVYRQASTIHVLFTLSLLPCQMWCEASGVKKAKTDAELEDELKSKDMAGFELSFVSVSTLWQWVHVLQGKMQVNWPIGRHSAHEYFIVHVLICWYSCKQGSLGTCTLVCVALWLQLQVWLGKDFSTILCCADSLYRFIPPSIQQEIPELWGPPITCEWWEHRLFVPGKRGGQTPWSPAGQEGKNEGWQILQMNHHRSIFCTCVKVLLLFFPSVYARFIESDVCVSNKLKNIMYMYIH